MKALVPATRASIAALILRSIAASNLPWIEIEDSDRPTMYSFSAEPKCVVSPLPRERGFDAESVIGERSYSAPAASLILMTLFFPWTNVGMIFLLYSVPGERRQNSDS